jgi:pyruvate,water dikinase
MQEPGAWAVPLTDLICRDATLTGGKAAGLALLCSEDLPVPPAYVLPVAVFNAHLPDAQPEVRPDRPDPAPELLTTLSRIAAELCPDPADRLVVRSSALGEDGETASFAGQNATYYYVDAGSVGKAVVDCWLSLWSEPALAYRAARASGAPFGMAVIIQRMVQSERSGVCFSQDPTGEKMTHALLESSWGLGAALVDGRVSPDRFWVAPDGRISQRKISRKRLKVAEGLRDPSGTRLEPVPLRAQTQASLTDIEVGQITDLARGIATRRGTAQDVEWAIDGDELYVLQSRPITAIARTNHGGHGVEGRWVLFKPTAENFQEPMTPMTVDLFRRVIPPFGRFIRGRFYVNADLAARLLPWSLSDEALADVLLMRGAPPEQPLDWRRTLTLSATLLTGYLLNGVTWHRTAHVPLESLAAFEPLCEKALTDDSLDALETLRHLILNNHPFRPIGEFPIQCNVSSVRYFLIIEVLNRLLARFAPDYDRTNLSLVLSGGPAMLSQQMVEGIRNLAEIARSDAEFADRLQQPGADLQAATLDLGDYHPFTIALEDFLSRFGHRAVKEIELMTPRWREDNTSVLNLVRSFMARQTAAAFERTDPHGLLLAAEDELHQALPRRWQRRLVDHLIQRIRYYVTLRENTRHYHTMAMATIRVKLKSLEQKLIQADRLKCEDDIFFLEFPEAQALDAGELCWQDVEPVIRDRRLAYQSQCLERPPETFNIQARIPLLTPADGLLVGDCASPGVARGPARIIRDPSVSADLAAGEILVAPYTDPAWTPLFPGAAAIIVEVGSYLSHAGTVAREYGIPCLVDVHGCMDRIQSGQQLRINATEGWVEIVP